MLSYDDTFHSQRPFVIIWQYVLISFDTFLLCLWFQYGIVRLRVLEIRYFWEMPDNGHTDTRSLWKSNYCGLKRKALCRRHILSLIVCNTWWLRYGWTIWASILDMSKKFFSFLETLRQALGPIRPSFQRVRGFFPWLKASGAWG